VVVLLSDAYIRAGHHAAAGTLLEPYVIDQRKRRSPRLSSLLRQVANLARATGDVETQLSWLQEAHAVDRKSGPIAAELADLAMALGRLDLALKVLRTISLLDDPSPMTRGVALLRQARIALTLGNAGQAELWTRKALREEPELAEAHEFMAQLKTTKGSASP
jgi:tetratricopeptide (TPR) repeat protein